MNQPLPVETTDSSNTSRWILAALGGYVFLGGLLSLAGWVLDIPRLADWYSTEISIQPNASVLSISTGLALVLLALKIRGVAALLGGFVGLVALATLFEIITGIDLGIDRLLMFGRAWGSLLTVAPGRMGLPGTLSWTLVGMALLAQWSRGVRPFVPVLGLLTAGIAGLSLTGYIFGADILYTLPRLTTISFQTASFLFAAGLGLVVSVPDREPMRTILDNSGAGILARQVLPFAILLPFLLGFLRVKGQEEGYYDTAMGTALLVLTLIITICALLWRGIAAVRTRERSLAAATEAAHLADRALRDADRKKDEFLATLAHELRNPLAPISNALEIISQADGDTELIEELNGTMQRQVSHMVRLIDDLLDVSRITRNRIELRKEVVELSSILDHSVEAFRPIIERSRHDLRIELPPEPIYLEGDPARLTQVFGNLLNNAGKYTEAGGRIELRALRDGNEAAVSVRDSGVGIPAEMIESIFEMFTQVDSSLERRQGGLGIGLSLVKRLVELHGGSVTARSEGIGKGSEFIVRLPVLVEKPVAESVQDGDHAAPAVARRILVVDDNRDAAESLRLLLAMNRNDVQMAHDGIEAVEKAATYRPDVILLDIGMPNMNGYDACRLIRQQPGGDSIVIIALTGWGQEADQRRSKEAGFDNHMVKPVDHAALARLLAGSPAAGA